MNDSEADVHSLCSDVDAGCLRNKSGDFVGMTGKLGSNEPAGGQYEN